MALIKQSSAHQLTRDAIVLDLGDLQRQGAAIVAAARAEAERIAVAARAERQRIVAGAAEEGRAAGFEAGQAAGHAVGVAQGRAAAAADFADRLAQLERSWTDALAVFESRREELLRSAQTDVLRLALAIAERVTKRAIQVDPTVVCAQVEAVLGVLVRRSHLVIRINPDDREVLAAGLPRLMARFPQAAHVELVDDASLARGSCVAQTRDPEHDRSCGSGEIDASIQTQLDRIVEALLPDRDAPAGGAGVGETAAKPAGGAP